MGFVLKGSMVTLLRDGGQKGGTWEGSGLVPFTGILDRE